MTKKILVTKDFHRKALKAIEYYDGKTKHDAADEIAQVAMNGFMSYLENECSEDDLDKFLVYMDKYQKEHAS